MRNGPCCGILIAAFAATPALADESPWYIGASAGSVSSNIERTGLDALNRNAFADAGLNVVTQGVSSFDDSDTAWSLFGGYRINKTFTVEASYVDLGTVSYRYSGEAGRAGGTRIPPSPVVLGPAASQLEIDTRGFSVKGIATAPLGAHFDIHGQVGMLLALSERSVSGAAPASGLRIAGSEDENAVDLFYGAGVGFRFTRRWAVSVDWQRFSDVGDGATAADLDAITFAVRVTM